MRAWLSHLLDRLIGCTPDQVAKRRDREGGVATMTWRDWYRLRAWWFGPVHEWRAPYYNDRWRA